LILRKIFKIIATRCHILRLKRTEFDFGSPRPLAGFRVLLRNKRGGKEKGEKRKKGMEG